MSPRSSLAQPGRSSLYGDRQGRRGALRSLARHLRGEPAVAELLAGEGAVVAVPDAGRAVVLAALADLGTAPVMLVVTPTSAEAERLVHDLAAFAGEERVALFPAWETLPFERVSPATETMGQRAAVLWRVRDAHATGGETTALVVVAPVKALLQRLAPGSDVAEPITVRAGDRLEADRLLADLVATGYRREYQVEHRGEVAVRGGIVDVFPSTGDCGIRIDLFGDEVDRLTEFDVADQRSVRDLDEATVLPCRELVPDEAMRARARELARSEQFAAEQFARIAEGEVFDGIESFLPWLDPDPEGRVLPDLLGPHRSRRARRAAADARPRRRARRGGGGARRLALDDLGPVRRGGVGCRACTCAFERLLERSEARAATVLSASEDPETAAVRVAGWPPALGDAAVVARRIGELVRRGCRVVVASTASRAHGGSPRCSSRRA